MLNIIYLLVSTVLILLPIRGAVVIRPSFVFFVIIICFFVIFIIFALVLVKLLVIVTFFPGP